MPESSIESPKQKTMLDFYREVAAWLDMAESLAYAGGAALSREFPERFPLIDARQYVPIRDGSLLTLHIPGSSEEDTQAAIPLMLRAKQFLQERDLHVLMLLSSGEEPLTVAEIPTQAVLDQGFLPRDLVRGWLSAQVASSFCMAGVLEAFDEQFGPHAREDEE